MSLSVSLSSSDPLITIHKRAVNVMRIMTTGSAKSCVDWCIRHHIMDRPFILVYERKQETSQKQLLTLMQLCTKSWHAPWWSLATHGGSLDETAVPLPNCWEPGKSVQALIDWEGESDRTFLDHEASKWNLPSLLNDCGSAELERSMLSIHQKMWSGA